MKIIFKNSNLVFQVPAPATTIPTVRCSANNGTGTLIQREEPSQYDRTGTVEYIDISKKTIIPVVEARRYTWIYFYNASKEFIGMCGDNIYSQFSFKNNVVIPDITDVSEDYNINGVAVTKADIIANAAYYRICFNEYFDPATNYIKVR